MKELSSSVDQIFSKWDNTYSPGCALAVIKEGEIIYQRGYGMANLEFDQIITPLTRFQIGSVSKQFTALAVALLVEEGLINLEDDIRKYFPELPDFGEMISVDHLVHHTSGLRDQVELMMMAGYRIDDVMRHEDTLELFSKQKALNFKPGEKHLYCNTGYTLMGLLVERVTQKSLRQFCEERIFAPLGMTQTLFHDDYKEVIPGFAPSYSPGKDGFNHEPLTQAIPGGTSLITTLADMAKWDQEFYEGKVLGENVIRRMHQTKKLNSGEENKYAFGLMLSDYRGLKTVGHGGSHAGYRAQITRFPEQHFSVVILCNLASMNPDDLAKQVADIYLEENFPQPKAEEKVLELSEEVLKQNCGLYFCEEEMALRRFNLVEGKFLAAIGPGIPLEALSENTFQLAPYPFMKFRFENEDGHKKMFFDMGRGKPAEYVKIKADEPTEKELDFLSGEYYSPEMENIYEIYLKDQKLLLKRSKYGEGALVPAQKDAFTCEKFSFDIFFERDGSGKVCGFKIYGGRAKGVEFIRKEG